MNEALVRGGFFVAKMQNLVEMSVSNDIHDEIVT